MSPAHRAPPEYYDFLFPEEAAAGGANLKILEAARKWKEAQIAAAAAEGKERREEGEREKEGEEGEEREGEP